MISEKIYTGDGAIVTYQVDWKIPSTSHVNVFVDDVLTPVEDYSIIHNSIRFAEAPVDGASIVIRVATSIGELEENPSGTSIVIDDLSGANTIGTVALNIDNVNTVGLNLQTTNTIGSVATNIGSVTSVGSNIGYVTSVGSNIGDVNTVAGIADDISLVVDNLASITTSSTAATNAANSALAASNSADAASVSALSASSSATTATTQAGLASSSASSASTSASTASTAATTATTKAGEASTSASNALASETSASASSLLASKWATEAKDVVVSGGQYSAYHWAQKAADVVTGGVIDDTAPSLVKTYSSNKIVATYAPVVNPTITGLKETSVAMTANNIDLSLGNLFTKTISTATTLTVSNVPASGTVGYFILKLTNGGAGAVTFPAGTKWSKGTAPTLTASGIDLLRFVTIDGGTRWEASRIQEDSK